MMKKNERLILMCTCGKIVSSLRAVNGIKPGTIVQSNTCYACKSKLDVRRKTFNYSKDIVEAV